MVAARFDGVSTTRAFALTASNELLKLALLSAAENIVGSGRNGGCRVLSRLRLPPPLSPGNFSASLAVLADAKLIVLARSNGELALFDSSHSPPPPPLPGDVRPTQQVPPRLLLSHSVRELRAAGCVFAEAEADLLAAGTDSVHLHTPAFESQAAT